VTITVHEWGDPASPALVCLHGVTSHGRHFRPLAERLAGRFHVLSLDQRGHGDSTWEPPWHLEQYVEDALSVTPAEPSVWLGHSFGGRVAYEVAAAAPERVERLVLLDPAVRIPAHVGLTAAENARKDRSYASFAEGIDRRYEESVLTTAPREAVEAELVEHLVPDRDGRFRYRYCQSAVVAAYGEMTRGPPPFERVRIPTLLVLGKTSYLPYDLLLDAHAAALGDLLRVERLPAGHTVLWDAFDETAVAVESFLASSPTSG
jgi:lipase